eukprot:3932785-Pleurochrysis_carterae.AAC.9
MGTLAEPDHCSKLLLLLARLRGYTPKDVVSHARLCRARHRRLSGLAHFVGDEWLALGLVLEEDFGEFGRGLRLCRRRKDLPIVGEGPAHGDAFSEREELACRWPRHQDESLQISVDHEDWPVCRPHEQPLHCLEDFARRLISFVRESCLVPSVAWRKENDRAIIL